MRYGILMLALISLSGCASMQKAEDILAWTQGKIDQVDAKIAQVKADQDSRVAKIEAITGTLDKNLDGKVSIAEAKQIVTETVQGAIADPSKRKLLTDPEFWLGLSGAIAGLYAAKTGVKKLYNGPPTGPGTPT